MGTRNLTCVIKDGNFKVAQYGQWDGYPDGAGWHLLGFLRNPENVERLRAKVDDVSFVTDEEWNRRMEAAGIGQMIRFGSEEEARYKRDFRWINRDLGYKVLDELVQADGPVELMDSKEFAHDSLFCEWAWVVDLDRNVFQAYKGFNHDSKESAGVFANVPNESGPSKHENPYYSVRLVGEYPLNALPTKEQLVIDCSYGDDEDEDS